MKSFFEKLKDILYDCVDYIIMILVIIVVILIINWRLGGLFAKDAIETPPKISETVSKDNPTPTNENKPNDNNNLDEDNEESLDIMVKIDIPSGSASSKIGEILVSSDLIKDKNDFIEKAIELKLDTKLKYGEFEIPKNSSLEEILKILTN
ncbi:MAG: endolytic transglycosylase MltG [Tissierellia bacterium]|nr:endolytic transglycosylase MltG [Tissierellia bacterium]